MKTESKWIYIYADSHNWTFTSKHHATESECATAANNYADFGWNVLSGPIEIKLPEEQK